MMRRRHFRGSFAFLGGLMVTLALPSGSAGAHPQAQAWPQTRGQAQVSGGQSLSRGGRGEASGGPQAQQPQRFGATVSRVRLDAIVTDGDGNFVADLTAADFAIYEDGERQQVVDVQLVDLATGEVLPLLGSYRLEAPAEGRSASGSDAAPAAASELGAVIFLIDGPGLSVQARARFGDAWTDLLAQTDNLQVPRAAYMVDNAGLLQELAPLGYDLEAMRAAADTVREAPFFGDMTRMRLIELSRDLEDPFLGEAGARMAAAKARSYEGQERSRSLATYELLTTFAEALWTRSGRTAVVWVSTGIKLMQGGPYSTLVSGGGPSFDSFSPDASIRAAQEALHRAANGSNVSLYTVDPSLLAGTRFAGNDIEVRTVGGGSRLSTPEMQQSIDGLRDAMRSAAAETGGRSFIHATDLSMVLREIEADTSRFYLLSYDPPGGGDGEYHEIRVEVMRDGTEVRARNGYVDHPPEERTGRLISAALALPGSVTDLPVEAEALTSRPTPGSPNVLMAVAVEAAEIGIMLTRDGERRASLDIHAVALQSGRVVSESHEELSARVAEGAVSGAAPGSGLTAGPAGYLSYQHEWTLAPGAYALHVAVFDNVTGRVGAASVDVEVRGDEVGWGVSDPLLVSIESGERLQPVVLGRVFPGQRIAVFVEVYDGEQPMLSGQVLLEGETGANPEQGTNLFPLALRRVAVDVHRGSAPLPTGMPPGRYVVQLVVTDPSAGEHRVIRLPLEVVAPRR